jgi:two-component system phosphate regulon sensor histidine kinase PhoR
MEGRFRIRLIYWFALPTIAAAAGILGYFSWVSAAQYASLGEQSIVQSTVLLVDEKVDRVEQDVINADNSILHLVDLDDPASLEATWLPLAERVSPSVRSILILDDGGNVITYASRGSPRARRNFMKVFLERILADLELERRRVGQLRHLHRTYADQSYLISYKPIRHHGRRHYVVAHHDTDYFVREVFPSLFVSEEGKSRYNIVDEDNHRMYGPSLVHAGDYLVGRRFPTTLYNWRLQIAPKQAPLLEAQRRSNLFTEASLVGLSFFIILLGIALLIYASIKESRLNALRTEFVANVSHELKTPLSVVRMFAEMLLTKRVKSREKEEQYLQIICRESERLSALIENVLDFAAIERGKQSYVMRTGDIVDIAQRAIDTFRFRLDKDGLLVKLETKGAIPAVRFDEQTILLAIMNLLDNAVKYGALSPVSPEDSTADGTTDKTASRAVPIELSIERGRRHVYLRVRDHGPGIPASERRRVFERFYRIRRDADTRGSGIGLSLVKRIVEAHGGRAWAENAPGGGAIVSFSLPLAKAGSWASEPIVRQAPDEREDEPVERDSLAPERPEPAE